jgi:hypothetical protein
MAPSPTTPQFIIYLSATSKILTANITTNVLASQEMADTESTSGSKIMATALAGQGASNTRQRDNSKSSQPFCIDRCSIRSQFVQLAKRFASQAACGLPLMHSARILPPPRESAGLRLYVTCSIESIL